MSAAETKSLAGPGRLRLLGWHNVDPTWCFPAGPGRGRRGLWRQLRLLARTGNAVPLVPSLDALAAGGSLPPRAFSVTFDDGYRDNLEVVLPMLRRLAMPATFFLVPGLLSREVRAWWEDLAWAFAQATATALEWEGSSSRVGTPAERRSEFLRIAETLKRSDRPTREAAVADLVERLRPEGQPPPPDLFLDWQGARRLSETAGVEIGSHTLSHPILSSEPEAVQARELTESRKQLEEQLGRSIDTVAYPNGSRADFTSATLDAVRLAGYRYGLTTVPRVAARGTPAYEIGRWVMFPERGPIDVVKAHLARPVVSAVRHARTLTSALRRRSPTIR